MKRLIRNHLPLLLLVLLVIPSLLPLFKPGFFSMHDNQQVVRLYGLDQALAAGQFPVRWVQNLGFGFGYPLFIFYPPFIYYLGETFHLLLGASFIASTKMVFAFAFLGAAFAMYLWAKEHFDATSSLTAAAFYTYAPYHAVDAYVRGALAELTSFVWLPLILRSTDRLIMGKEKKHWIWLGVWLALLMLTHNLMFLSFFPLFLIYVLILSIRSGNKRQALRATLYAGLMGFGLSAFFWLPALAERKFTMVDTILLSELADYKRHFVYPVQLWNSLWGYGGSTAGPLDGLSFKIGKLHIVLSALAIVIWAMLVRFEKGKKSREKLFHCLIVALLFIMSIFMTTQFSQPLWELVQPLQYLQFPWRYLTFSVLFSSFLAGSGIAAVSRFRSHLATIGLAGISLAMLLIPNLKLFQPERYLDVADANLITDEFSKWDISKSSFEFVPRGIKTREEWNAIEEKAVTQVDIGKHEIRGVAYEIISGNGEVKVERDVPGRLKLTTKSNEDLKLRLQTFDFPGWKVSVDGRGAGHESDNDLRLITVSVPVGEHVVDARFGNTPVRTWANLLSMVSVVILLGRAPSVSAFIRRRLPGWLRPS